MLWKEIGDGLGVAEGPLALHLTLGHMSDRVPLGLRADGPIVAVGAHPENRLTARRGTGAAFRPCLDNSSTKSRGADRRS